MYISNGNENWCGLLMIIIIGVGWGGVLSWNCLYVCKFYADVICPGDGNDDDDGVRG